jgi:hypothetical protein
VKRAFLSFDALVGTAKMENEKNVGIYGKILRSY